MKPAFTWKNWFTSLASTWDMWLRMEVVWKLEWGRVKREKIVRNGYGGILNDMRWHLMWNSAAHWIIGERVRMRPLGWSLKILVCLFFFFSVISAFLSLNGASTLYRCLISSPIRKFANPFHLWFKLNFFVFFTVSIIYGAWLDSYQFSLVFPSLPHLITFHSTFFSLSETIIPAFLPF